MKTILNIINNIEISSYYERTKEMEKLKKMIIKQPSLILHDYKTSGIRKPNATAEHVLARCSNLSKQLTSSDSVIIMCGSNDSKPTKLFIEMFAALKLLNSNVFIVNTLYNAFLNENRINQNLKLSTQNNISVFSLKLRIGTILQNTYSKTLTKHNIMTHLQQKHKNTIKPIPKRNMSAANMLNQSHKTNDITISFVWKLPELIKAHLKKVKPSTITQLRRKIDRVK